METQRKYTIEALEYISKLSAGGMRDAITMLDKCLAYSTDLTLDNVVKALGVADYDTMFELVEGLLFREADKVISIIDNIHMSGKDLKQFLKTFTTFVTDLCIYGSTNSYEYIQIPSTYDLRNFDGKDNEYFRQLLDVLIKLNAELRWETTPKTLIEGTLLLECY